MQLTEAIRSLECILKLVPRATGLASLLWVGIFYTSLTAQPISNKPYVLAGITNDVFGGGLTRTYDDQRTMGFMADAQFHVFGRITQVAMTYSALTNRYDAENAGRLDNLELRARYPLWSSAETFILSAIGGAMLRGNLGGASIQDAYHDLINIDRVDLPYEGDNTVHGLAGIEMRSMIPLGNAAPKEPRFRFEAQAIGHWYPGYAYRVGITGGFAYGNVVDDKLAFRVGYQALEGSNNSVQGSVADTESGLVLDYSMRLGFMTYGMQVYPGNTFAFGTVGISFLRPGQLLQGEAVDLVAETGGLTNAGGMYLRFLYGPASWDREQLNFEFRYQFWTLSDALKRIDLAGHYQQFNLGAQYQFIKPGPKFQVIPYIGATAGLNTEKVYPTTGEELVNSGWTFLISGEAGLKVKLPAGFIHDNCYYGLTGSYIYNFAITSGETDSRRSYQTGISKGQVAIGLFVMVDF